MIRLFKIGALVVPFVTAYVLLAFFGDDLSRFFARLFAGSDYADERRGPFTIFAKRGSGQHAPAGDVLEEFTTHMVSNFGAPLKLERPQNGTSNLTIYLLQSHAELEKYGLTRLNSDLANNGGFFLSHKLEIALVLTGRPDIDARGLRHEMVHALMFLSDRNASWPSWIAEGMASYFEHSRMILGTWQPGGVPGDRPPTRSPRSIRELLEATSGAFTGEQNRSYYDSSHLLVAFLIERRREQYLQYYDLARKGPPTVEAFEGIFGTKLEAMEEEWRGWMKDLDKPRSSSHE